MRNRSLNAVRMRLARRDRRRVRVGEYGVCGLRIAERDRIRIIDRGKEREILRLERADARFTIVRRLRVLRLHERRAHRERDETEVRDEEERHEREQRAAEREARRLVADDADGEIKSVWHRFMRESP